MVLTGMRPPILPSLLANRTGRDIVELAGKRVLLTGASSGIGEAAAEKLSLSLMMLLGAALAFIAWRCSRKMRGSLTALS